MDNPRIIVLYKTKRYKVINPSKLYHELQHDSDIRCLLFPSLSRNLVYYPILPSKCLLSSKFVVDITFDIGDFDFDENSFTFIDRFSDHYETTSVLQFIEYISIFYKIPGVSSELEYAFLSDGYSEIPAIYPIQYRISFDRHYKEYDIDSGELKSSTTDCYLPDAAFNWITDERLDNMSSIMYTIGIGKNSYHNLPLIMGLKNNEWCKTKHMNRVSQLGLDNDDIILVKLGEFNSYYLTTYSIYDRLSKLKSLSLNIIINPIDGINDSMHQQYAIKYNNISQYDREILFNYLKDECSYYFDYTFIVGDNYSILIWLIFNQDIISYLAALYKSRSDDILISLSYLGIHDNTSFSYSEIANNKFTKFMYKYIAGGISNV